MLGHTASGKQGMFSLHLFHHVGPVPGKSYGYSEGELATPLPRLVLSNEGTRSSNVYPQLSWGTCKTSSRKKKSGNSDKPKERPGLTRNGEEQHPGREEG